MPIDMHKQHTHTIHNYCTIWNSLKLALTIPLTSHWRKIIKLSVPSVHYQVSELQVSQYIQEWGVRRGRGTVTCSWTKTNTFTKINQHFYNRPSTALDNRGSSLSSTVHICILNLALSSWNTSLLHGSTHVHVHAELIKNKLLSQISLI